MSSIIESISKHLVTKWYLYILRKHRKCEEKHEIIATTKLRNPHSSEVRVVENRVRRSNEFFCLRPEGSIAGMRLTSVGPIFTFSSAMRESHERATGRAACRGSSCCARCVETQYNSRSGGAMRRTEHTHSPSLSTRRL